MNTITIICSGFHNLKLTDSFLTSLKPFYEQKILNKWLIFPTSKYLPYSRLQITEFLIKTQGNPHQVKPVFFIAFSAGVIGAIASAYMWQMLGGKVQGLIAVDGWGVPLIGNFPIYRISHDYFTHISSHLPLFNLNLNTPLGCYTSFYCQPNISHLDLWRSPAMAYGYQVKATGCKIKMSAAEFIKNCL